MTYFLRAFAAERLKLKRTLTIWMILIAPLAVCFLYLMIMIKQVHMYYDQEAWYGALKSILSMWSAIMLPLFITLETALTANSEHSNQTWKHLYALPIPRRSVFYAKWAINILLVFLSSIACFGFSIGAGLIMRVIFPETGFMFEIPWVEAIIIHGKVFAASLLIISIHTWISLNWKSIVVAIGSGMVAAVGNLTIMMSDQWAPIFPWTLPIISYVAEDVNLVQVYAIALGGGLLMALIGSLWISRKQIY